MTRDDIYDHLAQVYLGKRKEVDERKTRQFNAWLVINIAITFIVFASATYGLTAFLTNRSDFLDNRIIYALHQGKIRLEYNLFEPYAPVKTFALNVPSIDASKYKSIQFSIRGKEEGTPGVVKIVVRNFKNESSSYYIQGVGLKWQDFDISLSEFQQITDWSNIIDVSFVLETWNVDKKKGIILIEDVSFSS